MASVGQTAAMHLRSLSAALAAARIAFGSALLLAPGPFARPWIGRPADDPRTQVVSRGLGIRDVVLGVGGLLSLRRPQAGSARWWCAAQATSDTVDALATLAAGRSLPRGARLVCASVAAGSAAVGWAAAAADRAPRGVWTGPAEGG